MWAHEWHGGHSVAYDGRAEWCQKRLVRTQGGWGSGWPVVVRLGGAWVKLFRFLKGVEGWAKRGSAGGDGLKIDYLRGFFEFLA